MTPADPKPLSFPAPFPDIPPCLVYCEVERQVATDLLGPPAMTEWVEGLGNADFWAFEYPCGLQLVYQFLHYGTSTGGIVTADSPEIEHAIRHIPFKAEQCFALGDEALASELKTLLRVYPHRRAEIESLHAYQVWRNGDDGNSFAVGNPTSERDAKCMVQHYDSLGHKQCYWYSRVVK